MPGNELGLSGGDDNFVVLDASVGYRFPNRLGIASLQVNNLLLPDDVEIVQGTFDSRKLCTGGRSPNVRIECRKQIEDWPARNLNLRNVPCQINVSQCGVPGGLVDATSSSLTINRNGRAPLQCHFRQ